VCEVGDIYPDISNIIEFFEEQFDWKKAKEDKTIIPKKGSNEEYDKILEEISQNEKSLDLILKDAKKTYDKSISFKSLNKDQYQLEVPKDISVIVFNNIRYLQIGPSFQKQKNQIVITIPKF
jgi:hypothetical protein